LQPDLLNGQDFPAQSLEILSETRVHLVKQKPQEDHHVTPVKLTINILRDYSFFFFRSAITLQTSRPKKRKSFIYVGHDS